MKRISIPYFPTGIKYSTPLLLGLGIYLWLIGHPVWLGIIILPTAVILTTSYVTEIDLEKKEFRDFVSILSIPFQEEIITFNRVEKIIITKENHSQRLNSKTRFRQIDWLSFTGTLVTDDNKTLKLLTKIDKNDLIKQLREFADFLEVDIEDQTSREYVKIDISKY